MKKQESATVAAHKRFIEQVKERVRLRQKVQKAYDRVKETKNGNPMGRA